MKNRRGNLAFVIVALIMAAVLLVAVAVPVLGDTAPVTGCPAGQTCHFLFGENSQAYNLCANGHWEFEMYGADSMLAKCVSGNRSR